MPEVRFYHMMQKKLVEALPEILSKALEREYRIIVKAGDRELLKEIDENIWTYKASSFIPHSMTKNNHASEQPIWLTTGDDNPNNAKMLMLIDGVNSDEIDKMDLCCELFDGNDEDVVSTVREHWKEYKDKGYELSYFQQDEAGKWFKKQ